MASSSFAQVALLQPLFRSVPALQNAVPARASKPPAAMPPRPFAAFVSSLFGRGTGAERGNSAGLPGVSDLGLYADSPVSGLLAVDGTIGGSASAPTGNLEVRLDDGAIGEPPATSASSLLVVPLSFVPLATWASPTALCY